MLSLTMPGSNYSLDVGFKAIEKKEKTGNFLVLDTPELYDQYVVQALKEQGQAMQKTASIFAWPLGVAEEWATKDISGEAETVKALGNHDVSDVEKNNARNELFLVFSDHEFNYKTAIQTYTMAHTMAAMAKTSLSSEQISALQAGQLRYTLNTAAYGVWTMDANSLKAKYDRYEDNRFPDVYIPKAEAMRVIAPIHAEGYDGIEMPTTWGSFKVQNGGHVAVAVTEDENDPTGYQQFQRNMDLAKDQPNTAELFLATKEEGLRSVLDIYGIEPGFVQSNYKLVNKI